MTEAQETALRMALRIIEESHELALRMAEDARQRGYRSVAKRYHQRVDEREAQAEVIWRA